MKSKRVDEKTPNGGDYSEIFYFDENGNLVDEKDAQRCIIRQCKTDGTLISEVFGVCNN